MKKSVINLTQSGQECGKCDLILRDISGNA